MIRSSSVSAWVSQTARQRTHSRRCGEILFVDPLPQFWQINPPSFGNANGSIRGNVGGVAFGLAVFPPRNCLDISLA
jgi:hypothetical protein